MFMIFIDPKSRLGGEFKGAQVWFEIVGEGSIFARLVLNGKIFHIPNPTSIEYPVDNNGFFRINWSGSFISFRVVVIEDLQIIRGCIHYAFSGIDCVVEKDPLFAPEE